MLTPFFGSAYVARSSNLADQQLINLYPEIVENKGGKAVGGFFSTPGLTLLTTVGSGPIRGLFESRGILYAVSGNKAYSIADPTTWIANDLGLTISGTGPVLMIDSGAVPDQIGFFGAGAANSFVQGGPSGPITLPFTTLPTDVITPASLDGFVVINQPRSQQFWASSLFDLTSYPGLSFASASGDTDFIQRIIQLRRQLYIQKNTNIEVWDDAGLSPFPFQRLDGVLPEQGCYAPYTTAKLGEGIYWLGKNAQGGNVVLYMEAYTPIRVSTHAIEFAMDGYSDADIAGATAFAYEQEGHAFYVLNFPEATWCYDRTASEQAGMPMWHQRALFTNSQFQPLPVQYHAFFGGYHVVGGAINGNLYAFDLNATTDNGIQRKWLRSWRALPKASYEPVRFSSLVIDMETGIGVPPGTNPQCILRWSDDGGHLWSNEYFRSVGASGATAQRVKFNRLGSTKRNTGLDRIFELSSTDNFPARLIAADLQ